MLPKSLSATALDNFVLCPAMFQAQNIEKTPDIDGEPGMLGTVCHTVLEEWIKQKHYLNPDSGWTTMLAMYVAEYWGTFVHDDFYQDGVDMLERWFDRQDWSQREVVSTEQKLWFPVPVKTDMVWPEDTDPDKFEGIAPGKPVKFLPFNYIIDRLDWHDEGWPIVVDYKTIRRPLTHEELRKKIQARCYSLAVAIHYKEHAPQKIWVEFDLLRYDRVGVIFTPEDNRHTWRFLTNRAQQIIDTIEAEERVNHNCGYCVRRIECDTLLHHVQGGGIMGFMDDPVAAIDRVAAIKAQQKALKGLLDESQSLVIDFMEEQGVTSFEGDESLVKIRRRKTNIVADGVLRQLRGIEPDVLLEIVLDHMQPTYSQMKKMIADDRVPDAVKSVMKQSIRQGTGAAWLDAQTKTED